MNGGRFDFDDGGTYCGGWEEGKAHGHGVCTGPKGQGEYSGAWHFGFEVSGIYTWPSGNTYEGQWQNGKRHGLGVERRGRWIYRGEWTQGYKGRYGLRQSSNSQAKYEGTWSSGLQDGYGTETYADGGTYQGQWLRGMRHGYGVRKSAPYGVAAKYRSRSHAHASLTSLRSDQGDDLPGPVHDKEKRSYTDEGRGGFVLRARSEPPVRRRSLSERSIAVKRSILQGLRITKQRSTGDIHQRVTAAGQGSLRSSGSTTSCASDESAFGHEGHEHEHMALAAEDYVDPQTTETYMGEWKNDKRSGFGISERSDGLRYEGEWFNNKKFGYGCTTMKDGAKEEGKYKNNMLVTSQRKKHLLFVRSSKLRERIDAAVNGANRGAQIALQKADIGISRTATARDRAEQGDYSAMQAKEDSDVARICAKQFDPTFRQPGTEFYKRRHEEGNHISYAIPERKMGGETSIELSESRNPHHRSQSLFIPSNREAQAGTSAEEELVTPPMETPPSELRPASSTPVSATPDPNLASSSLPPLPPTRQPPNASPRASSPLVPVEDDIVHARDLPLGIGPDSVLLSPHLPNPDSAAGPLVPPHLDSSPTLPHSSIAHVQFHPAPPSAAPAAARQPMGGFMDPSEPGTSSAMEDHTSSRASLNIMNDHFDQYRMAANPVAAKQYKANLLRTQNPTPSSGPPAAPVAQPARPRSPPLSSSRRDTTSEVVPSPQNIQRRSTLASTRDWTGGVSAFEATNPPVRSISHRAESEEDTEAPPVTRPTELVNRIGPLDATGLVLRKPQQLEKINLESNEEPHGSLPDLTDLVRTPVQMTREEASRLSSQRRQELVRIQEEEELLRGNPLRYLFHPTVRAWFARWKLPLLVLLVNVCLSLLFYQLLTYQNSEEEEKGGSSPPQPSSKKGPR